MGGRSAVAAVIALALGATAIDFAGRLLSTLADGAFMLGVVAVVLAMHRRYRDRIAALRQEVRDAQAREIAAVREAATVAVMTNKGEMAQ